VRTLAPKGGDAPRGRIPLAAKLAYTAFVALLVPVYLHYYGPTNFLYFCDVALLLTVPALWLESRLLASMGLVGMLVPQLAWQADFITLLFGRPVLGTTDYMRDMLESGEKFLLRGLSLYHFWLSPLLLYAVWRLGYDRWGFWAWTALAWVVLPVCYFLMPGARPPAAAWAAVSSVGGLAQPVGQPWHALAAVAAAEPSARVPAGDPNLPININYVYGPHDTQPQQWMHPTAWFLLVFFGLPLGVYLPTHLALGWLFPRPNTD
jgi:hypothetical protein